MRNQSIFHLSLFFPFSRFVYFKGLTIKATLLDDGEVKNARVYNTRSIKYLVCNKSLSLETDTGGAEHAFEYKAYGISPLHRTESFLKFLSVYDRFCFVNSANFSYHRVRTVWCGEWLNLHFMFIPFS